MSGYIQLVCAVALSACSVEAAAQEQTPEGAATFLRNRLAGVTVAVHRPDGQLIQTFTISRLSPDPSNVCRFRREQSRQEGNERRDETLRAGWVALSVEQAERQVVVTINKGWKLAYNIGDASAAARVAYAMEFLRTHCDPDKDTGF